MSKQTRILLLTLLVVLVAMVVLTKLGTINPPVLGPLLGAEEAVDTTTPTDTGTGTGVGVDCPTSDPTGVDPAATGADPATGSALPGTGTDAGTATDGAIPGTGAATTGAAASDVDPGYTGGSRVLAADAGAAAAAGGVDNSPVLAADASTTPEGADPAATDPAATAGTGAAADPAATTATTDPGVTPSAIDPCAPPTDDPAVVDPTIGGTPDTPATGTGASPATGTGTGGTAKSAAGTSDGTNSGNSPEALRIAADATGVMQQAQIAVSVDATLLPGAGGTSSAAALRTYRGKVTAAALVIKLADANAQTQWTSAGKRIQVQLVRSFLQRLRKNYPKSARSVSVVDSSGTLLAVGDATTGRASGPVKLY